MVGLTRSGGVVDVNGWDVGGGGVDRRGGEGWGRNRWRTVFWVSRLVEAEGSATKVGQGLKHLRLGEEGLSGTWDFQFGCRSEESATESYEFFTNQEKVFNRFFLVADRA